jgi:hypothetical protein
MIFEGRTDKSVLNLLIMDLGDSGAAAEGAAQQCCQPIPPLRTSSRRSDGAIGIPRPVSFIYLALFHVIIVWHLINQGRRQSHTVQYAPPTANSHESWLAHPSLTRRPRAPGSRYGGTISSSLPCVIMPDHYFLYAHISYIRFLCLDVLSHFTFT